MGTMDYYLYFPSEDAARRVAARLNARGFTTSVQPSRIKPSDFKPRITPSESGDGRLWLTLATRSMTPADPAGMRPYFTDLCKSEHGVYDGWETEITNEQADAFRKWAEAELRASA
jgi:hypothetical protein